MEAKASAEEGEQATTHGARAAAPPAAAS